MADAWEEALEIPPPLSVAVACRLAVTATRAFAALGITGYGRVDLRVTPQGDAVFLEANPLPSLTLAAGHDELYVAAARLGHAPRGVLAAVLDAALPRGQPGQLCA